MAEPFDYLRPLEARRFLQTNLGYGGTDYAEQGQWDNLFCPVTCGRCNESVFLKNDHGVVVSLAIIAHNDRPEIASYYTLPEHRNCGHGYRLLVHCIERIILKIKPDDKILIRTISRGSRSHVRQLPAHLGDRLHVINDPSG